MTGLKVYYPDQWDNFDPPGHSDSGFFESHCSPIIQDSVIFCKVEVELPPHLGFGICKEKREHGGGISIPFKTLTRKQLNGKVPRFHWWEHSHIAPPNWNGVWEDVQLNTICEDEENGFEWTPGSLHCALELSNFTAPACVHQETYTRKLLDTQFITGRKEKKRK